MTEKSYLWDTSSGIGDGATTYTRADWAIINRILGATLHREGVVPAMASDLVAAGGGANTVNVGAGGAIVDGRPYYNDASKSVTIPSAVGGGNTRIDRIVLRADWTAQTVRITRLAGTDAASPTAPAITQSSGTVYDIQICQVLVNTSGAVTVTDERVIANIKNAAQLANSIITTAKIADAAISTAKIADAAISTVKLADGSVATAKIADDGVSIAKIGTMIPGFLGRQGGHPTDFDIAGSFNFTSGINLRMQIGSACTPADGSAVITYPVAFSAKPIVLPLTNGFGSLGQPGYAYAASITTTGFTAVTMSASSGAPGGYVFFWLAIGPE